MKQCPFCAEQIQDEAIKCRWCGAVLSRERVSQITRDGLAAGEGPAVNVRAALNRFAEFRGRSSRGEFWWFFLFCSLAQTVTGAISRELAGLSILLLMVPLIAVTVRRLHDHGLSGSWAFAALVPIVGTVPLIYVLASVGAPYDNEYGPALSVDNNAWAVRSRLPQIVSYTAIGVVAAIGLPFLLNRLDDPAPVIRRNSPQPTQAGVAEALQMPVNYPGFQGIVDLQPAARFDPSNYIGTWVASGPIGTARLMLSGNGTFLYVSDPGTAAQSSASGTWSLSNDVVQLVSADLAPKSVVLFGLTVQDAAPYALLLTGEECYDVRAIGCGSVLVPEGTSAANVGSTSGADDGRNPMIESLHTAGSYVEDFYFGTWVSDGRIGPLTLQIDPDGQFTYGSTGEAAPTTGTWRMNMDVGLMILEPTEGEPASVAVVLLAGDDFALLFTTDDCGSFDASCGDIFVEAP